MYQPRYQQPAYRPTPSPERRPTPTPVPVPPRSPAAPSPEPEPLAPSTALVPRVLTVDEVSADVTRHPEFPSAGGLMVVPRLDSPRAAKRFEKTAAAVAHGWSHLSRAAVAQANARNTAALSIQRAAEIGAAAQKACGEATLHRAKTLDEIAEISDRAEIRAATRTERLETALLQSRLDRQRARLELVGLTAKTDAESAQFRHVTAASDLEAARLRITRAREEWQAAEDARLEALAADTRARTFLADAALDHDRVIRQRVELREQAAQARYDAAFARQPAPAAPPTPPTPPPDDPDAVLAGLGATAAREELRTFFAPAVHGVLSCHPLAALVRGIYRSVTALEGRPKADALREAARAALTLLEQPHELRPADLVDSTQRALADIEARIAAKERADLRSAIDEEDAVFFGTDPHRSR